METLLHQELRKKTPQELTLVMSRVNTLIQEALANQDKHKQEKFEEQKRAVASIMREKEGDEHLFV